MIQTLHKKTLRHVTVLLFACVWLLSFAVNAATYYIDYVGGADANAGTATGAAWKRHPYMTGWTGSYTHAAGDRFIFKGGVTWDSAALPLAIANSGASDATRDYYGMDVTWYAGGAWTRPVFNGGGTKNGISLVAQLKYLTLDGIEVKNVTPYCVFMQASHYITVTNCYLHAWTGNHGVADSWYLAGGVVNFVNPWASVNMGITNVLVTHCTILNSDGDANSGSGVAMASEIAFSEIGYAPELIMYGAQNVHDNDVHDLTVSYSGDAVEHPNVLYFSLANGWATATMDRFIYNNWFHSLRNGTYPMLYLSTSGYWKASGNKAYIFNNLFTDVYCYPFLFETETDNNPVAGTMQFYIWNNTFQINGRNVFVAADRAGMAFGYVESRNNHSIDGPFNYNPTTSKNPAGTWASSLVANDLAQTMATANAQGYNSNNFYYANGSTVNAGTNMTYYGLTQNLTDTTRGSNRTANARPASGAWNIGAYQYGAGGPGTNPLIAVSPASIDFGLVLKNTNINLALTVQNVGGGTLAGTASIGGASAFRVVSGGTYSLGSNQSQTVTVGFNPAADGLTNQTITFTGGGGASVSVMGVAYTAAYTAPATNWYVDNAAAGSGNGTNWANAWTSFASVVWGASGVKAGDTLFVSGGNVSKTYVASGHGMLTVGASGTSGSRITLRVGQDAGHNGNVVFNANGYMYPVLIGSGRDYVTLDGRYNGAIHLFVTNCSQASFWAGNDNCGVNVSYANYPAVLGVDISTPAVGIHGIYGNGGEFAYNNIHDIREESGIRLVLRNGSSTTNYDLTTIHNNTIQVNQAGGSGADGISGCRGLTIYSNTIYGASGTLITTSQHQDLIQVQAHYVKIFNNDLYDGGDSMIDQDNQTAGFSYGGDLSVFNNTLRETNGKGGLRALRIYHNTLLGSVQNLYIDNNTFVDMATKTDSMSYGIAIGFYNGSGSTFNNVHIRNNIFYNCGHSNSVPVVELTGFTTTGMDADYNLINAGSSGNGSFPFTQAHGRTAAPSFVSYTPGGANNDLNLSNSDTAAKDNAETLSTFSFDKDNTLRPQGSAWDIGAYEFRTGVSLPPTVSAIIQSGVDVDPITPGIQVYSGSVQQYSGSASDPSGLPLTWQWIYTVNGGAEVVFNSGTGTVASASFNYTTGTAGNIYVWKLRVSNGGATAESSLTVGVETPPAGTLTFQATSGTITAPFAVTGGYISQSVQTGLTGGGQAVYAFTITNAGNYMIQALVNAGNSGANSYYVNIDAQPQDPGMIWDMPVTSGFEQRIISWRGNGTDVSNQFVPQIFNLTAGTHQLIIVGREANVQLQSLSVLKTVLPPPNLRVAPL